MLKKPEPSSGAGNALPTNELGSPDIVQEWIDVTMKTALALDPKAYIREFWNHKTRPDGRIFGQARQTTIVPGVLERNALGSALVKLASNSSHGDGDSETTTATTTTSYSCTHVLAGVTTEVGQPSANEGDLKVSFVPQNIVLESWLQRLLLEILDLEQLGIVAGKSAFGLDVSIAVLNEDGNLADACLLAAMAALRNTRLPPIVIKDGRVYTLEDEDALKNMPSSLTTFESKSLSLPVIPLPLTMGVVTAQEIGQQQSDNEQSKQLWLVDPSKKELEVCDGSITIVLNGLDTEHILAFEYQGNVSVTHTSLALAVQIAKGRAEELLPLLKE